MIHATPLAAFVANGDRPEDFEESFVGVYDSEEQFALEQAEGHFGADNAVLLAGYFDEQRYARDLFRSDFWSAPAPGVRVYVFAKI